jgi:hypothetical protein
LLKKICLQADQKDLRGEAREKSTRVGVLSRYVGARRLSATKHMSLFQQPAGMIGGAGTFDRSNAGTQFDVGVIGVGGLVLV